MPTMITAVVRPYALEGVKEALKAATVSGMTVTEVRGHGRQGGHSETYRGTEYAVDFVPKVKLEVAVGEDKLQSVVDTIIRTAQTGQIGDGKIFISDLRDTIRIRTGETGNDAL